MFLGLGALTDFSPLIQRPYLALLGAAAQVGIFGTLFGAILLGFTLQEAAAVAMIGGADGPTAIFVSTRLAPEDLWGPIAVSAFSYMALVPMIQPPIMKLLTTAKERSVMMDYDEQPVRPILLYSFPLLVVLLTSVLAPRAIPIIGMFMFGNLLRISGRVERLAGAAQNELANVVTIFLGLSVGGTMTGERFLDVRTLSVFGLGLVAFSLATASGVLLGKVMYLVSRGRINPLLGAAGVSAVPESARVVHTVAQEANPANYLVMHAMGPNVAGRARFGHRRWGPAQLAGLKTPSPRRTYWDAARSLQVCLHPVQCQRQHPLSLAGPAEDVVRTGDHLQPPRFSRRPRTDDGRVPRAPSGLPLRG